MLCPACKRDMIVIEYKKIELDYCANCRGVWFDAGELELILEQANLKPDGVAGKSIITLTEADTGEKKRRCPICRKNMRKEFIGGEPPILIDACPAGQGLWFDGGEVTALLSHLSRGEKGKEEQVISFMKELFGKTP
jgi:Zn-finger nucleic acid-binding protein